VVLVVQYDCCFGVRTNEKKSLGRRMTIELSGRRVDENKKKSIFFLLTAVRQRAHDQPVCVCVCFVSVCMCTHVHVRAYI